MKEAKTTTQPHPPSGGMGSSLTLDISSSFSSLFLASPAGTGSGSYTASEFLRIWGMVHWFESAFDISKIYDLFVLLAWLWIGTSSWFCFVLALHGNYFVLRSLDISLDPPNWGNARCPRFGLFVWPAGHKLKQSTPQISVFNILIALHSRVVSQTRMTNESLATLHFSPINKESIAKTQLFSFRRTKEESLYECLEKTLIE